MKNILFIPSSSRGSQSHSHQIARRIVDDLKAQLPGTTVTVRDVARYPLPHIGEVFARGRGLPPDKRDATESDALALSDTLVGELLAADIVVLAVPLHNFGIPSTLKAWIDHVVRPGVTFSYSAKGPEGLVKGKKVILVVARGGVYSSGPMQAYDFQEPYLRAALGFIGLTDIYVVRIEGVGMGEDALRAAMASATNQATAVVNSLIAAQPAEALSEAA
jgi:FMN-dependent NADH-azoreductase